MATTFATDRVPPGPTTWIPGGNFLAFRRDPLTFFTKTARAYGDVARFSFGSQPVYLVSHPDMIEDVLVTSAKKFMKGIALQRAKRLLGEGLLTSEGQLHLRQRRTIQPLFHRQQVQRFAEAMVRHAVRWRDGVSDGTTINVTDEMGGLTLAIVGETLFSTDVQQDAGEVREALTDAVQSFAYAVLPGMELIEKLPVGPFVKVRKARARLDRIILRVIAERRADKPEGLSPHDSHGRDLISMLLMARDPENPSEPGMNDQQIRDEAMTIFLAGHETTANAMAWTFHLLGHAAGVESRLHEELDRVLQGRVPTVEDVPKLEYTRAVVAESMRLHPPAWTMGRRAIEPHTIGGYAIEPNALVLLSQWVAHRDPRWWPNADSFTPERWLGTQGGREPGTGSREPGASVRPKYAYFPFGGGTRICIGESFAWTEAILLLAAIAQQWRFTPVKAPTPEPRITLRPAHLQMRASRR
jgi:cytochrome P450